MIYLAYNTRMIGIEYICLTKNWVIVGDPSKIYKVSDQINCSNSKDCIIKENGECTGIAMITVQPTDVPFLFAKIGLGRGEATPIKP